jgi:DNA invertase Pin-like site-specific DNA recombinase
MSIDNNTNEKLFIYIRVSTLKQAADDKNGLNIQLDACSEYFNNTINKGKLKKNYLKFNLYKDIGSSYGYKNKLIMRNKLLQKLSPKSLIIIYDISRIGRNTIETIEFLKKIKKKDSMIYSVTDNLFFNKCKIMDKQFYYKVIDSEKNSDLKSIACKKKISDIKSKGGFIGKVPFGYYCINESGVRKLKENFHETHVILLIKKKIKYYSKQCSNPYFKTCEYLNNNNILYRDKLWTTIKIRYIYQKLILNK